MNKGLHRGGILSLFPSLRAGAPDGSMLVKSSIQEFGAQWAPGGWIPENHTWTYSSVSGHTSIATVNANVTTYVGVGDRVWLTQGTTSLYFIVTAISYAAPSTTITMYGGAAPVYLNASYTHGGNANTTSITVSALAYPVPSGSTLIFANGDTTTTTAAAAAGATTISISSTTPATTNGGWFSGQYVNASNYVLTNVPIVNPYYSHLGSPVGFPVDPQLWTEQLEDNQAYIQSSPVSGTWYSSTLGGSALLVPIGAWRLYYSLVAYSLSIAAQTQSVMAVTLSTSTSSASDADMTAFVLVQAASGSLGAFGTLSRDNPKTLAAAATYYLIGRTTVSNQASVNFAGIDGNTVIRAICSYL